MMTRNPADLTSALTLVAPVSAAPILFGIMIVLTNPVSVTCLL
jgi:hypothetical protein